MVSANLINSVGVSLILLAFLLLTLKKVRPEDKIYNLLNLFGAGLAGIGAYMINSMPFVVLEVIWVMVALFGLYKSSVSTATK